jgi:rod shape-determining protein MreC
MKPLFSREYSQPFRLGFCVLASLMLLAMEQRGALTSLRAPLAFISHPLQKAMDSPFSLARNLAPWLTAQNDLKDENQRLKEEVLALKAKELRFDALEQENIRLRGLLETSFKVGDQVLIAEPLSITLDPLEHIVTVNKGTRFGVFVSQAVLDSNGIVGQIFRVTPYSADVIMITNPGHAIPVQVNRNGLRTIAVGTGQSDRLELPYLRGNADIQPGDLLVTSGLGGVFPPGYPVAKVLPMEGSTVELGGRITARPVASLERNHELLLVWSNNQPIPRIPVDEKGSHGGN